MNDQHQIHGSARELEADSAGATEWLFETGLIFLLFFLHSGWPTPSVNESHYLTKAKHYWDPAWCPDDMFLGSADVHLTFYWTLGWLTCWLSLDAFAWLIRCLSWLLLAAAWRQLSWTLIPRPLHAVLSAAWLLLLLDQCHMAGEWMVGGAEAKGVAYALVVFGLDRLLRGHWNPALAWFGTAAAFHVLVGGWSLVAAGIYWAIDGRHEISLRRLMPGLVVGGALALLGVLPALLTSDGAPSETRSLAHRIYVYERLPHHLALHHIPGWRIARFVGLTCLAGVFGWRLRRHPRWRRLGGFTAGALAISLIGALIHHALLGNLDLAASLLRYYWYRLADVMVPASSALLAVAAWDGLRQRPRWAAGVLVVAVALPGWHFWQRRESLRHPLVPTADRNVLLLGIRDERDALLLYSAWRDCCDWVAETTPREARFLSPRRQQTFKWYAGRAEVANWKDLPQDAASIVAWWKTLRDVYPRRVVLVGLTRHSDQRLWKLSRRYRFDYILLRRHRRHRRLGSDYFHRVYPTPDRPNLHFEVYRVRDDVRAPAELAD